LSAVVTIPPFSQKTAPHTVNLPGGDPDTARGGRRTGPCAML